MSLRLKNSERQKMLIEYVRNGVVPEGFYVKHCKNGTIQFRRVKNDNPEALIERYEEKIRKLREAINVEANDDTVLQNNEKQ